MTRCGFVALAGLPNAGKSTLLNALVGEPLAIVSPKPQTTREPVRGLISDDTTQIILVDPAGLLDPAYAMQRAMLQAALAAVSEADLILHVQPLPDGRAPGLATLLPAGTRVKAPILTVYTKADLMPPEWRKAPDEASLVVSASSGEGIEQLLAAIRARLPEGPFLYSAEDVGTQPLRFFAAEFVREAAFAQLEEELPYSLAVTIDEFQENARPILVRATIGVERDSQKGIVLGAGGRTIKAIGIAARQRLEAMVGAKVRLELWVKVWPKWRKDPAALARLGMPLADQR